jgi:NAD-dependent DNA ligase
MSSSFSIPDFIASPKTYIKTKSLNEIFAFLELANEHYRNRDDALITDDLYDWLEDYARTKDPKHSFFKLVGAPVENKTLLPEWMGSLDKVRDDPKALVAWVKKYPAPHVLSEKLDGNSGMFGISKNKTYSLFTRGDGTYGRDISSYAKYFHDNYKSIEQIFAFPEINKKKDYPLLVRGELIISKAAWERIKHKGSNARNVLAGTLNAKTPDEEIARHIDFVAYELIEPKMPFYDGLQFIKSLGIDVVYHKNIDASEITNSTLTSYLLDRRANGAYDIDGVVVRDNAVHKIIKEKNPKYAFAFKTMLTHEAAEVTVMRVNWNVSKDGLIKPIVEFTPVVINNVNIKQASGFNGAFIVKHCIGVGSKITIIRSGDVIPHITGVLTKATSGKPDMPEIPYVWTDTHVDVMIMKDQGNAQMDMKQMVHFAKKLEITHVGEGVIKKLYNAGIDTIPKLLQVTKTELLAIEGIQERGAEKIYQSISTKFQSTDCFSLMIASNIFGKGFGERKLKLFVDAHPEILETKPIAKLKQIDGVGAITGKQFLEQLPAFYKFLKEIGYTCKVVKKAAVPKAAVPKAAVPKAAVPKGAPTSSRATSRTASPVRAPAFPPITVVFTGFRNKDFEKRIEAGGGKVGSSISKNTGLLVTSSADDNSSKVLKARELGIRVIDKDTFAREYGFAA